MYLIPVLSVTFVLSYRLGDAGGWRHTIAGPEPGAVAATFADIEAAAGRAGEEITRAVTLLQPGGPSPDALPELTARLVAAVRATGTDVTFRRAGDRALPPAVAADALRIIQEGLTNAMKHAPGSSIAVTLELTGAGVNVEIVNGAAESAPVELDGSGGAGLAGMTERARAHGGQLSAGPAPGGGWRVAASLPAAG